MRSAVHGMAWLDLNGQHAALPAGPRQPNICPHLLFVILYPVCSSRVPDSFPDTQTTILLHYIKTKTQLLFVNFFSKKTSICVTTCSLSCSEYIIFYIASSYSTCGVVCVVLNPTHHLSGLSHTLNIPLFTTVSAGFCDIQLFSFKQAEFIKIANISNYRV